MLHSVKEDNYILVRYSYQRCIFSFQAYEADLINELSQGRNYKIYGKEATAPENCLPWNHTH